MARTLWSVNGLATELQRDRRTVAEALSATPADGETHGRAAWFMTTALAALETKAGRLDAEQERARKDRALAIQAELRNAQTQGEVVLIDDVITHVTSTFGVLRNRLLAMPGRATVSVPGELRPAVWEALHREVVGALTELSESAVVEHARQAPKQRKGR